MKIPFIKKETPISHSWELVAQTQSETQDTTSLLFVNELGEFNIIELPGLMEKGLDHYTNYFSQTGLQSVTVDKQGKKIMIVQIPDTKLPAKNVNITEK